MAEVADRSQRLQVVTLEQAETGRVVPAVLEALEALHQQVLRTSFADVSDDPAHPKLPSPSLRPSGHFGKTVSEPQALGGADLPLDEGRHGSTEILGVFGALGLRQDAHEGLGS